MSFIKRIEIVDGKSVTTPPPGEFVNMNSSAITRLEKELCLPDTFTGCSRAVLTSAALSSERLWMQMSWSFVTVVLTVAEFWNVHWMKICSLRRESAQIVEARQVAYFLTRFILQKSTVETGALFDRDHSTIVSGCQRIKRRAQKNEEFARLVLDCGKTVERRLKLYNVNG